jgi:hypothetical protein
MSDKVIFRKYPQGDVIALFPRIPFDNRGNLCLSYSYQHLGQHGGADFAWVIDQTFLATPKEYASLAKELRDIGYKLEIAKKTNADDLLIRRQVAEGIITRKESGTKKAHKPGERKW